MNWALKIQHFHSNWGKNGEKMWYTNMEMGLRKSMVYLKDLNISSSVPFLSTCVTDVTGWDIENLKVQDAPNRPCYLFCAAHKRIGFIIWESEDWYSFIWIFCLRISVCVFSIWGSKAPESMNHSELLYIITSHCYRKYQERSIGFFFTQ